MKTVLLAYEREQDLAAVESVLQSRGHRILRARTGLEALDAIRTGAPDAVVSDVMLPRLDGFALCRRLREEPALMHLPVYLHSFRVEGPKYEAFAAEVGAQRFFPRTANLEELAVALDDAAGLGTNTMRMPALLPELLDRREQDRRKLLEAERQLRELEATNQQLAVAERVARERAEHEARARAEFAAAESARIKELQARLNDLETAQRAAAEAESRIRGAEDETRAEAAKLSALEARLEELQSARARATAVALDSERAFISQPTPSWVVDMETRQVHLASDSAAAFFGVEQGLLRGKPESELVPELNFPDDSLREIEFARQRQDGSPAIFQAHRQAFSYASRACWLMTIRDVTAERAQQARFVEHALRSETLEKLPQPCAIADGDGALKYGNAALLGLLGVDQAQLAALSLQQLENSSSTDTTVRNTAVLGQDGRVHHETHWRRPDGVVLTVELAAAPLAGSDALRVLTVRDVSAERRTQERNEREHHRVAGLLELAQRAPSLTENEILQQALQLAQETTNSAFACLFLPVADMPQLELAAKAATAEPADALPIRTRWRGVPPPETALHECFSSQRTVVRDAIEGTSGLRSAGVPAVLHRQLVTPVLDGGRLAGIVLVAEKPVPYDDDDRRHCAYVADALWKLLRRRKSDAEVVSAMDHMERVMFGAIESLAQLAEAQDACKVGRARRVADYAAGIGTSLGLPGHAVRGLRVMGQLIDVGMLQIPRELLWRPGTLSAAEFELVKTHAALGFELLRNIEFPWPVAETVRQHHERLDGSGYPRGLKGEEISLEARIVAVADAVEAMLAKRPHRPALTLAACIDELQSQAGRRYDAQVVKACVKLLRDSQSSAASGAVAKDDEATAGVRIA